MKKLISVLVLTLIPAAAFADKPYGVGGCGLGSMLMGKDGNQVLAITTNGTGTQTFAITSGTSNCVDSGVVKKDKEARVFIESNQRQLANDISKGGGDSLAALANLYSCKDSAAFGAAMQRNYTQIFPEAQTSADHVEWSIQDVMSREQSANCHRG